MSKKKVMIIIKSVASAIILILGIITYQGGIKRNTFSHLVIVSMVVLFILEITLKYFQKEKGDQQANEKPNGQL